MLTSVRVRDIIFGGEGQQFSKFYFQDIHQVLIVKILDLAYGFSRGRSRVIIIKYAQNILHIKALLFTGENKNTFLSHLSRKIFKKLYTTEETLMKVTAQMHRPTKD